MADEEFAAEGHTVATQVLALVEQVAPAQARWLGAERVLRVERLRSIESRPLARIRTYLPLPTCAPVAGVDLADASLHETLTTHLDLTPTSRPRQVRAVSAGPELATELDVAFGSPLLLLEGQTADQHG